VNSNDLVALSPKFKDILPDGEIMVMFDYNNKEDMELARKLKVFSVTEKKMNELKRLPTDDDVFVIVEDMPEFPGGEKAFKQFVADNVNYPVQASDKGIQGRVYVQFVVNENGMVENPKVVRGVDPLLDEEAIRVISSMPAWKPGKQKGKAVKVSYTAPINFKLQ
jgi:TonB family protein